VAGRSALLAGYAVLAAADAVLAATGHRRLHRLVKPLLMPTLAAACPDPRTRVALGLGGLGDIALEGSSPATFTAGLSAFLVGHTAWITALRPLDGSGRLRRNPVLALPHLAAFGALNAFLWRRTGPDRLPVLVYSGVLVGMALVALDSGSTRAAAGGTLFVLSDTLIALDRFADLRLPGQDGLVMATYAAAQALLASGAATSPSWPKAQPAR
jgi:uncharacterized membrane protein YhhN